MAIAGGRAAHAITLLEFFSNVNQCQAPVYSRLTPRFRRATHRRSCVTVDTGGAGGAKTNHAVALWNLPFFPNP